MGFEPLEERAEDEASGLRRVVVFGEVGECSSFEAERAALPVDVLVAEAEHDLDEVGG